MKKLIVMLLGIAMLGACHNYKKDAERLTIVKDSLENVATYRDSTIASFLDDFSQIQANLDSIKEIEKIVSINSETNRELSASQKQIIIEDIAKLHSLLEENKALTASLQKKLRNSNVKNAQLEKTISGMESMINSLEKQIREKDVVIADLTNNVKNLNVNINELNKRIEAVEKENQQKSLTIETKTSELNTAYFAFGTMKELKENGIVEKSGGVIGIGKTPVMKKDFNREYFTEIDVRDFDYLRLMAKKAKLITVHPEGSYHFTGEKSADTLFIDNSAEFWKVSKYLVVLTD